MNSITYPRLIKRTRAVLIDSLLLPVSMLVVLLAGTEMGVSSTDGKIMLLLFPLLILEPGMVTFTGGTFGHHVQKIRVTKIGGSGNINFFAATIRFIVKLLFGWLSFIFVFTTVKHQALHDLVARSVVIHKNPTGLPEYDVLLERSVDGGTYAYPAVWRRIAIIILYGILASIALSMATVITLPDACINMGRCSETNRLLDVAFGIAWLVCLGGFTVMGWNGMLYGCRRKACESAISTLPHN